MTYTMVDEVTFLKHRAEELRDLAQRAPTIADALHRLADELDAKAAELKRRHEGSTRPEEL